MKNKMAKIAFIILSIVFIFSACMTVFAVTTKSVTESQNGIEATLNFNKQEYNANEEVEVTLNVKNNNSYAVNNIQTELIVPSTIKLSTGSLKQETFSLNAGESKVQEVALEKVVEANNEPATNSPQTGDNVVVYIAMMTISAVGLVAIAVKKKWIHKKKVMSLVLCFTLVGAMTLTSVVNANVAVKEFTVEGTIKYDGEDVVIKGKVTYDYEVYSKVQIDGVDKGMYAEGTTVTIEAEDAEVGKHFAGWTVVKGNVTLADVNSSTTTFVMGKEDVEIKSNYEVNTYTITSSANEGGTITESATVNYGGGKTFTITPNIGYHIEKVEVDGQDKGTNDTYTFTDVKENHTIKATFAIDTFTIRSSAGANGTITESATVNYGDSKTFIFSPNTGYSVYDVQIDGNSIGAVSSYTFENVRENHTISVTYKEHVEIPTMNDLLLAINQGTDAIKLLSDLSFEDVFEDLTVENSLFIDFAGHEISGSGRFRLVLRGGVLTLFSGTLDYLLARGGTIEIMCCSVDAINLGNAASLCMYSGSLNSLCVDTTSTAVCVKICGGVLKELLVHEAEACSVEISGGTFYFNPTNYLDTDKYEATQTKDADGVDIWVVTEK